MAEYLIQDATLDAIADAINAKTGGSSAMTPAQMVQAIGSIPSGGGGSLPSSISKIDGGSFTVTTDARCDQFSIVTTLNSPAKYFLIWTDELDSFETVPNKALILATVNIRQFDSASGTTRYGFCSYIQRQPTGATYQNVLTMNYANNPEAFTDNNMIRYYISDTYYIAGKLYKWVAFV